MMFHVLGYFPLFVNWKVLVTRLFVPKCDTVVELFIDALTKYLVNVFDDVLVAKQRCHHVH